MKKALAETLFEEGVLSQAMATRGISGGFNLAFKRKSSLKEPEYLVTERGAVRTFKTADALLALASHIGFKKVEFNL